MSARCRERVDAAVRGPSPERVRIDADQAARSAEGQELATGVLRQCSSTRRVAETVGIWVKVGTVSEPEARRE
jgi:hypothetical protein